MLIGNITIEIINAAFKKIYVKLFKSFLSISNNVVIIRVIISIALTEKKTIIFGIVKKRNGNKNIRPRLNVLTFFI